MKKKLNIYLLNENYYHYLFNENKLDQMLEKETRPYIGFIGIEINNENYVIPLWSDPNNKIMKTKGYSLLINDNGGNKLGVLRINKMIPILNDEHFINEITFNNFSSNPKEGIRLLKELEFVNKEQNYNLIHQLANEIYHRRYNATENELVNDNDLKFAVDFKQAEKLMYEYAINLYKRDQKNNIYK